MVSGPSDNLAEYQGLRDELGRIAYRMLGSLADVDDVLQEAYLRWSRVDLKEVESPRAFLISIVTRLCIDRRREIDIRKEHYPGPWLPEPIVTSSQGAGVPGERDESVSLAFLYVLERLTPVERAAYLLRKVFDFEYAELSSILDKSVDNCRQIVSRAETRVMEGRPRFTPSSQDVSDLSERFLAACASGDLQGLLSILRSDAELISDGGGKATAARRPILGADAIARFFLGIFRKAPPGGRAERIEVNGQPGLALLVGTAMVGIYAFDVEEGQIRGIYVIRNPDKLVRASIGGPTGESGV